MHTFDLTPLYRSTVGFDRLAQLLDSTGTFSAAAPAYPPYNIERTGENAYRISIAVAGFTDADLAINVTEQTLTVKGQKASDVDPAHAERQFLYRGIAGRAFERQFELADHVEVNSAALADGLLHIDLVRNVPERLKPRTIAINAAPASKSKQLQAAE
jgi:molecular chaperone IbpA